MSAVDYKVLYCTTLLLLVTGIFNKAEAQVSFPPEQSSVYLLNKTGSFGLYENGLGIAVKNPGYNFLAQYGYYNSDGFRKHSLEYGHSLDLDLETFPSTHSTFSVKGYYRSGRILFPGSLTESEFKSDPYRADKRSTDRDQKKTYNNGQIQLSYKSLFGKNLNNEFKIDGSCSIEAFQKATREYRIVNKYGLNLEAGFVNRTKLFNRNNTFSVNGNIFYQPERTEYYENFGGIKNDQLEQLVSEKVGRKGLMITEEIDLIKNRFIASAGVGYHDDFYRNTEQTSPSRDEKKFFNSCTPEVLLKYLFTRDLFIYTSYSFGFKSPDITQLDSPLPLFLYNQNLRAQSSQDAEVGINGDLIDPDSSKFINSWKIKSSVFYSKLKNEIISYEVFSDYFFRNADASEHSGVRINSSTGFLKSLVFSFTYSWLQFKYGSYPATSLETDSVGNLTLYERNFSGKTEPGIPVNTLEMNLKFDHSLTGKVKIFAGAGYLYKSQAWADDGNTTKIPAYDLFNASAGIKLRAGHFDFLMSGGIENIFNRVYVGYININSADKRYFSAGPPRNIYATFNIGYIF